MLRLTLGIAKKIREQQDALDEHGSMFSGTPLTDKEVARIIAKGVKPLIEEMLDLYGSDDHKVAIEMRCKDDLIEELIDAAYHRCFRS